MTLTKASLQLHVLQKTLRDRISGKISPHCVTNGRASVFSLEEDARIVKHVKSMALYGYEHTRQEANFLRHDKKYRLYSPMTLTKASLQLHVLQKTLRDRISGKISPHCVTNGRASVFSLEEDARIVKHVKSMALYGYEHTRQEVTDLATGFAFTLYI
ncbi:unnamed protein product [Mytilus edulis]|uniref:Uncharacterized protein n=1 Tax=Mytilus edulis TaxID=6550 RepID=A0A8S3UJB6_MYTED|nr:unnamed protein product [Mytilus edulis]